MTSQPSCRCTGAALALTFATLALWAPSRNATAVSPVDAIHAAWRPYYFNLRESRGAYYRTGLDNFFYDKANDFGDEWNTLEFTPRLGFAWGPAYVDPDGGGEFWTQSALAYVSFPYSERFTPYIAFQYVSGEGDRFNTSPNVATDFDGASTSIHGGLEWHCPNFNLDFGAEIGYGHQETDYGVLQTQMGNFGTGEIESDFWEISGTVSRDIIWKAPEEGESLRHFRNNLIFTPFFNWSAVFQSTEESVVRGNFDNRILFEDSNAFIFGLGLKTSTRGRCPITDLDLEKFYYLNLDRYEGGDVRVIAADNFNVVSRDFDTGGTSVGAGTGYTWQFTDAAEFQVGYHFKHFNSDESGHDSKEHRFVTGFNLKF